MENAPLPAHFLERNWLEKLNEGQLRQFVTRGRVLETERGPEWRELKALRWFMQVYSIQFLGLHGRDRDDIFGTIKVGPRNDKSTEFFSRRTIDESRNAIDSEGFVKLRDHGGPINAKVMISIYPRLYRDTEPSDRFHPQRKALLRQRKLGGGQFRSLEMSPAEKAGRDGACLWVYNRELMNKVLHEEVETTFGPMEVTYAVFEDSAEAFLCVKLDGWDGGEIYGTMWGTTTMPMQGGGKAKSIVFSRNRDEAIVVKPQQFVPLDRPDIVVPMDYALEIHARLMHRDANSLSEDADKVIANVVMYFDAQCRPLEKGREISAASTIPGELGTLEVKVIWSPWWASPKLIFPHEVFTD